MTLGIVLMLVAGAVGLLSTGGGWEAVAGFASGVVFAAGFAQFVFAAEVRRCAE